MTVGELADLLMKVDRDRMVYIQDIDGTAQPAAYVVDIRHLNLPEGIQVPDDVAIMTANTFDELATIDE